MIKEKRLNDILNLLKEQKSIQVQDLCTHFQVTPVTIRRDLAELEEMGKLVRTHGGAISIQEETEDPLLTELLLPSSDFYRYQVHVKEKKRIAETAVQQIHPGQKLFLGSGSTVFSLSFFLHTVPELTVATDAIPLAYRLNAFSNIHLLLIGGELLNSTFSTSGNMAEKMLTNFKFDAAFISLTAIDRDGQMYLNNVAEFGLLQTLFIVTDKVYILVDSSKIGQKDFIRIGRILPNYTIITDAISNEYLQLYQDLDVEVIIAK